MSVIATGQISIVDLSDGKSLSCYLTSNLPKTQVYDPNDASVVPDWTDSGNLVLTPVVFVNQNAMALNAAGLSVTWKRREGASTETALASGETVSNGVLTVNVNKLTAVVSGLLSYLAYVTYTDPENGLVSDIVADITFSQIKTAVNAKLVSISGEQVFKYDVNDSVSPAQITLNANLANVTVDRWQYKNESDVWTDYPATADNANITSDTLNVKPSHGVFNGDAAVLRILTSEAGVTDTVSIYKVRDGQTGSAGSNASTVFLTNENITFAGNASGEVAVVARVCNVVGYTGASKVTPAVGAVTGAPTGMTVEVGAAVNNEIPITITIAEGAMLGGSGQQQGVLSVPITSPVSTTLQIQWSKVNTGVTGADGQNAVVFSLYAPNGSVFLNQAGSLPIQTSAYDGTAAITSGATFVWKKYTAGSWNAISGETGSSLTVSGGDVSGVQAYQCVMTYGGETYTDILTLTDKTDNFQAVIESSGGDVFKNSVGTSTLACRLFQNGTEVDEAGTEHTYTWYRRDKDGNAMDSGAAFATGKSVTIDGDDVDVKTTFTCEVSQLLCVAQLTIRDETDIYVSDTAPHAPVLHMLWLDTSVTPNLIKCWTGTAWMVCGSDVDPDDYYTKIELNTRFSQTDQAIALKADQTVTDNLGSRLSSAESTITAQAQQITAKVSQTEFDGLTIGGRNLVRNSSMLTLVAETSNYVYESIYTGLKQNTQYALSIGHITLDAGTATQISWRVYDLGTSVSGTSGILDTSDARQSVVLTTPNETGSWSLLLYAGIAGATANNTVSFYRIKLEEGNKPTDWTVAPEDIDENIHALNTATQTLSDDISETAQNVAQNVLDAVANNYGTRQDVQIVSEALNSLIQQTATDIELVFQRARTYTVEVTGETQQYIDVLQSYQRFSADGLELGVLGSPFMARLGNTRLSFVQSGEEIAYISNNKLYITSAHVTNRLTIGNVENGGYFDWITTPNGLALKWRSA